VARAALLLAKAQLALVCFYVLPHGGSAGAGRRLRRVFAFVEAAGLCYRVLLPAPLWFHFFFHAAESYPQNPNAIISIDDERDRARSTPADDSYSKTPT